MVMKNVTKKIQKIPYLLVLLLLSCLPTLAQNGVTVKGTVVDGTGETVIGASIVVKGNTSIWPLRSGASSTAGTTGAPALITRFSGSIPNGPERWWRT